MEHYLLQLIEHLGYIGIFIATLIESTFVPIPAEVTVIPAGVLAAKGVLNYWGVLAASTAGVIAGSALNYWIGLRFGRALIIKYGKYIFIQHAFLEKTEKFFAKFGPQAVFIGRLLPVVKHYISFVAGIAAMRFQPFIIYTALGGLIWMWLLLQIGFMAERSAQNGATDVSAAEMIILAVTVVSGLAYFAKKKLLRH